MKEYKEGQYIQFSIGSEAYALPIQDIQEIVKMQEITVVPGSKKDITGVINLRGNIVPVVSMWTRFGLPGQDYTKQTRVLIVTYEEETVGMIVDCVHGVSSLDDIQSPPERAEAAEQRFVSGIARAALGLVRILHLPALLHL
jgi:purine-binding chemotaxis protein CheW